MTDIVVVCVEDKILKITQKTLFLRKIETEIMDKGYYEDSNPELFKRVNEMFTDGNSFLTIAEELGITEEDVMDILTEACYLP